MKPVTPAKVEWRGKTPFSPQFDDFYFSKDRGLEETRHVFMEGNALPDAWLGRKRICIFETGFGTGLNFLSTLKLWRQSNATGRLDYIAVEKHPLCLKDLKKALGFWPELAGIHQELIDQYPPLTPGFHYLEFGSVSLTLIFGDAVGALQNLEAFVDCWILDGFTPAKNEGLWTEEIFKQMERLSVRGATFATFTAARPVRDGLANHNFEVRKQKGFGSKRDMLAGSFKGTRQAPKPAMSATVIGAGIAGAAVTYHLMQSGVPVTVIDPGGVASGTSSNPSAVVYPRLTADFSVEGQFYLESYLWAIKHLKHMAKTCPVDHDLCGVIQLGFKEQKKQQHKGFLENLQLPAQVLTALTPQQAKLFPYDGVFFPQGGWVNLKDFTMAYLDGAEIKKTKMTSEALVKCTADSIVLANGCAAQDLTKTSLHLQPVRGQLMQAKLKKADMALPHVVTHDGYIAPANAGGWVTLGSTYDRGNGTSEIRAKDRQEILNRHRDVMPDLIPSLDLDSAQDWAGVRSTTPQRFPLFGSIEENIYASLGHGSHGATTAPYSGMLLARQLTGRPIPKVYFEMNAAFLTRNTLRKKQA